MLSLFKKSKKEIEEPPTTGDFDDGPTLSPLEFAEKEKNDAELYLSHYQEKLMSFVLLNNQLIVCRNSLSSYDFEFISQIVNSKINEYALDMNRCVNQIKQSREDIFNLTEEKND